MGQKHLTDTNGKDKPSVRRFGRGYDIYIYYTIQGHYGMKSLKLRCMVHGWNALVVSRKFCCNIMYSWLLSDALSVETA
jgi:hypothetical protein